MRTVTVTRYVTPLREGGSMPAIVEADDDGLYVLKFRGAGQGPKALIAEHVAGSIAQELDLPVPERVLAELDVDLGRTEPDPEIQELIQRSGGANLALDYLPGSVNFDPVADAAPPAASASVVNPELASGVVWLDAFISNVDRTARNTNMLVWHGKLWLIDHGASLYFHHRWGAGFDGDPGPADAPFDLIRDHVLLPYASQLKEVSERFAPKLSRPFFEAVVQGIPNDWLLWGDPDDGPEALRAAYVTYLTRRLERRSIFVEEAIRARSN